MPQEEKEDGTKASVYMPDREYDTLVLDAARSRRKISNHLLGLIRLGKALLGEYDWKDALAIYRGKDPDRDWMKGDIKTMAKDVSLREYRERLLKRLEASKETMRFSEIQAELIKEELEEVEHLLEE